MRERQRQSNFIREREYQQARADVMRKVDAYLNGEIPSIFSRHSCNTCNGRGYLVSIVRDDRTTCPQCHGEGAH